MYLIVYCTTTFWYSHLGVLFVYGPFIVLMRYLFVILQVIQGDRTQQILRWGWDFWVKLGICLWTPQYYNHRVRTGSPCLVTETPPRQVSPNCNYLITHCNLVIECCNHVIKHCNHVIKLCNHVIKHCNCNVSY